MSQRGFPYVHLVLCGERDKPQGCVYPGVHATLAFFIIFYYYYYYSLYHDYLWAFLWCGSTRGQTVCNRSQETQELSR